MALSDLLESVVGGASQIPRKSFHPADRNPTDDFLTVGELTAYGAAWMRGQSWPVEPATIPLSYLTRAVELWTGGEFYLVSSQTTTAPQCWSNPDSLPAGVAPGSYSNSVTGDASGTAVAQMSSQYNPGVTKPVKIAVVPATNVAVYAIEEQPPADWAIANISHFGHINPLNGKVQWGPFFDNSPRTLTYEAAPPANATGHATFIGTASFDGINVPLTGARLATDVLLPLRFLGVQRLTNGLVQLTVSVDPGFLYQLELSTNLETWSLLGQLPATNATVQFLDVTATNSSRRFYRALLP